MKIAEDQNLKIFDENKVKDIRAKLFLHFRELLDSGYKVGDYFELDTLCEKILDDISDLLPGLDYFYNRNRCGGDYLGDVLGISVNGISNPFLREYNRSHMDYGIESLTHGLFSLDFEAVIGSRKGNSKVEWLIARYNGLGDVNLDPREIERSYLMQLDYGLDFRCCFEEIDFLKERLEEHKELGEEGEDDPDGLLRAIKYLEGFAAQDSRGRSYSYCCKESGYGYDCDSFYQAWSPGCLPAVIDDGDMSIQLCTAVSLVPNENVVNTFVEDFVKSL